MTRVDRDLRRAAARYWLVYELPRWLLMILVPLLVLGLGLAGRWLP